MSYDKSALVDEIFSTFRQMHGEVPFTLRFFVNASIESNSVINGVCDFSKNPPEISIRDGLNETELIETLFHELAHLFCGLESKHDNIWDKCKEELSLRFAARGWPT